MVTLAQESVNYNAILCKSRFYSKKKKKTKLKNAQRHLVISDHYSEFNVPSLH